MQYEIHVDGGARGNPGPSGVGVVIADPENHCSVLEAGYFLGHATNNVAEYNGLIRALSEALKVGISNVKVFSDSELMVRQINGQYRVKSPALRPLFEQVMRLLDRFTRWEVTHVRREQNKRADELANMAMDRKKDVVVVESPSL